MRADTAFRFLFRSLRAGALLAAAFAAAGFGGGEAFFAPKASLWERWTAFDSDARESLDHGAWNRFLDANLEIGQDGVNRVAYGRVSAADRAALDGYVERMTAAPVTRLSRAEQLAYWINLYNALTVKLILAYYPVESIRDIDISPGLFSDGPWDRKLVEIEGEPVSLNDIEHRILRPIWRDPRIHYAVNCASIGCPNLQKEAFTPANTERLLEAGARAYVNHRRGVRRDGNRLVLSSIYAWFIDDFGGDRAGVLAHLERYAGPRVAALLETPGRLATGYDWSLNDADRD